MPRKASVNNSRAIWVESQFYPFATGRIKAGQMATAFSETHPIENLKKIDVPTLILHDDNAQFVPIGDKEEV
jgi:hypothetical protein